LNQTILSRHDAIRQAADARLQLADAIGVPPTAVEGIEILFEGVRALPARVPDEAVRRQALQQRPDLLSALAEYASSEATLQLEIARQYPDIRLNPGYYFDQGENKWTLGLSVTLPILNQNQGAIAIAEAGRKASAARFNALQATVIAAIERAVTGYQMALDKLDDAKLLKDEAAERVKAVSAMLSAGHVSRVELSQQELELSAAALALIDTQSAAQIALGTLEDALQVQMDWTRSIETSPRLSTRSQP
jgi:outer membrane protein TolC